MLWGAQKALIAKLEQLPKGGNKEERAALMGQIAKLSASTAAAIGSQRASASATAAAASSSSAAAGAAGAADPDAPPALKKLAVPPEG